MQCSPREKSWKPELPGHCLNGQVIQIIIGSLNAVSDFSILILPLPLVWALKLDTARKIRVMGILCIGLLACVASVVRLGYIVNILHMAEDSEHYLLYVSRIGVWT